MKSVRIWSFSSPYFPAFGLNTERYKISLHTESKCGKIRTRKTPNTDTFHAVDYNNVRSFCNRFVRRIVKIISADKTPGFKLFDATLQCFQTSIVMSHYYYYYYDDDDDHHHHHHHHHKIRFQYKFVLLPKNIKIKIKIKILKLK